MLKSISSRQCFAPLLVAASGKEARAMCLESDQAHWFLVKNQALPGLETNVP